MLHGSQINASDYDPEITTSTHAFLQLSRAAEIKHGMSLTSLSSVLSALDSTEAPCFFLLPFFFVAVLLLLLVPHCLFPSPALFLRSLPLSPGAPRASVPEQIVDVACRSRSKEGSTSTCSMQAQPYRISDCRIPRAQKSYLIVML